MLRILSASFLLVAAGCELVEDAAPSQAKAAVLPGEGLFVCLPLPAPRGRVTRVTPSEAGLLRSVIENAQPNETVVLTDGTYPWTAIGGTAPIAITAPGLTLRGESANANAVTIDGEQLTNSLFHVHASDVTFTDLTVARTIASAIWVVPTAAPTIRGQQFHRLRFLDVGGYAVDVRELNAEGAFADEGVVQCSRFELTDATRSLAACQAGAARFWASRDWTFRLNTLDGYHCDVGLFAPAVFSWFGARDIVVENNVFRDCERAITFGFNESGSLRVYPDDPYPTLSPAIDAYGGVARNNFISGASQFLETGIAVENARGVTIAHNTVLALDTGPGFFATLDMRWVNAGAEMVNNIAQNLVVRNGSPAPTVSGNLLGATPSLFIDGANQDLHLAPTASAAIDQGGVATGATHDVDGAARTDGLPDIGADELGAQRPLLVSTPERSAACGVPYGYAPSASGTGPFAFSLASATEDPIPSGLTFNGATGAIAWRPTNAQAGLFELDLRVDGPTGVDVQRVEIDVTCVRADTYGVAAGCAASPGSPEAARMLLPLVVLGLFRAHRRSRLRSASSLARTPRLR